MRTRVYQEEFELCRGQRSFSASPFSFEIGVMKGNTFVVSKKVWITSKVIRKLQKNGGGAQGTRKNVSTYTVGSTKDTLYTWCLGQGLKLLVIMIARKKYQFVYFSVKHEHLDIFSAIYLNFRGHQPKPRSDDRYYVNAEWAPGYNCKI